MACDLASPLDKGLWQIGRGRGQEFRRVQPEGILQIAWVSSESPRTPSEKRSPSIPVAKLFFFSLQRAPEWRFGRLSHLIALFAPSHGLNPSLPCVICYNYSFAGHNLHRTFYLSKDNFLATPRLLNNLKRGRQWISIKYALLFNACVAIRKYDYKVSNRDICKNNTLVISHIVKVIFFRVFFSHQVGLKRLRGGLSYSTK